MQPLDLLLQPLLQVQVIGAGLQVGLMAVLNVFFYLDQRRIVLWLCVQFVLLNVVLTGLNMKEVGALILPSPACREVSGLGPDASMADVLASTRATYCLGLHPRLPPIDAQLPLLRALWPGPFVCRWSLNRLHGAQGYEAAKAGYAPFERLVDPCLLYTFPSPRDQRGSRMTSSA